MKDLELVALSADEIESSLQAHPGWSVAEGQVTKTFSFDSYLAGLAFVSSVAHLAEELQHHPDIHLYWRRVVLAVNTHDVQGISVKDFELAARVDQLI